MDGPDADLTGQTAVVTGANGGLGLETTRGLAGAGARVVLACRDRHRGERAADDVVRSHPTADVTVRRLDLGDLASIERFADGVLAEHGDIDLLVNNAGVMALPRRETADGFERQFGVNHLGHFALTGRLYPALAEGARVVTVTSAFHRRGRIDFADLRAENDYDPWDAYAHS
jgi:NAD(P)-dependent dehydrogenase (short-subunit alcohol dehydrogenase family)